MVEVVEVRTRGGENRPFKTKFMINTTITKTGAPAVILEPRDLRIGNILDYDGQFVEVTELSMDIDDEYNERVLFCKIGDLSNEMGGWNRAICDKLNPILLTVDILEKCGFSVIGEKPFYSLRLKLNSTDELCWYSQDHELRYQTQGSGFTRSFNTKYLHQLQNLYFILSGEDLKIKL